MLRIIWVLWPSFLVAGIAEGLFFTVIDPQELYLFGEPVHLSKIADLLDRLPWFLGHLRWVESADMLPATKRCRGEQGRGAGSSPEQACGK